MQGPWEAMLTFSEDAKPKDARLRFRMQGNPWESCSSFLCGLTVFKRAQCPNHLDIRRKTARLSRSGSRLAQRGMHPSSWLFLKDYSVVAGTPAQPRWVIGDPPFPASARR